MELAMAKKRSVESAQAKRPKRVKLSAKESLRRTEDFDKRKESFIAAVRKGTDRGLIQQP
jgi:hypothetical protein